MLKAGPDKKCKAKKSMKREVRGASPPKTGEDQEKESCKEKKLTKCDAGSLCLHHFTQDYLQGYAAKGEKAKQGVG